MLRRKITEKLLAWKNQENKPCLLVKGARQVGKTYIIEHFARENYPNYIYINFEFNPEYKEIFSGALDFGSIKEQLEVNFPDQKIEKGQTLLFLDEIQACPNARTALKPLALDGTIDVVASGSLLGLHYKEVRSYPVGYELPITLYPLDFEEYLWGMGMSDDVIKRFRDALKNRSPLTLTVANKMNEYFRKYMLTGGMPAVVEQYFRENSLQGVLRTQVAIIDNYKEDVLKYAGDADKQKILRTFQSIPAQLAKKNKKFVYADIDRSDDNPSERKYSSSLSWLMDAGIAVPCYNLNEPAVSLEMNKKPDIFKLYMGDTGLLVSMLETGVQKAILNDDLYVNEGAIVENVCAAEIMAHYESLYYFERKGKLEIDFILNLDGVATALEVKSGNNKRAKSLYSIIENYPRVGRYIMLERGVDIYVDERGIEHLPIFMVAFL